MHPLVWPQAAIAYSREKREEDPPTSTPTTGSPSRTTAPGRLRRQEGFIGALSDEDLAARGAPTGVRRTGRVRH